MPDWNGRWAGGRTYENVRSGRGTIFVIEKNVHGARYSIPLGVGDKQSAEAELALFMRDPVLYKAQHQTRTATQPEGLRIDDASIRQVIEALRQENRTESYLKDVARCLADWADELRGKPLQAVTKSDVERILRKNKARNHRLAALKSFCTHFTKAGDLAAAQNPAALVEIKAPPPGKLKKQKGYSMEVVAQHYGALDTQPARDLLLLRAKAGMHGSEVERIAAGDCHLREVDGGGTEICAVVSFIHKGRHEHAVSLDGQMYAAVKRLMSSKYAPGKGTMGKALKRAAVRLGKKVPYLLASELRHSFISWATAEGEKITVSGKGVDLREVQQIVGHRDGSTITKDHYLSYIPPFIRLANLKLVHPDDPRSDAESAAVDRLPRAAG